MTKFTGLLEKFAEAQRIKEEIECKRINKANEAIRRRILASDEGRMLAELTKPLLTEIRNERRG